MVDFTEEKIKNLLERIDDNDHHISVLSQNKINGKAPHFLQLKSPKIRYLEEEETLNVESSFRIILEIPVSCWTLFLAKELSFEKHFAWKLKKWSRN